MTRLVSHMKTHWRRGSGSQFIGTHLIITVILTTTCILLLTKVNAERYGNPHITISLIYIVLTLRIGTKVPKKWFQNGLFVTQWVVLYSFPLFCGTFTLTVLTHSSLLHIRLGYLIKQRCFVVIISNSNTKKALTLFGFFWLCLNAFQNMFVLIIHIIKPEYWLLMPKIQHCKKYSPSSWFVFHMCQT